MEFSFDDALVWLKEVPVLEFYLPETESRICMRMDNSCHGI